jgi:hypothetical protein
MLLGQPLYLNLANLWVKQETKLKNRFVWSQKS